VIFFQSGWGKGTASEIKSVVPPVIRANGSTAGVVVAAAGSTGTAVGSTRGEVGSTVAVGSVIMAVVGSMAGVMASGSKAPKSKGIVGIPKSAGTPKAERSNTL
jgi:hypothetical protein